MTREEISEWFQRRFNRPMEAYDVYKVAKEFYQLGAYSRALVCLQIYITLPGATTPGRHLLAYCLLHLGETERSLREFKKCVKEGYHDDWQLVVELTIELELARRAAAAREREAGLGGGLGVPATTHFSGRAQAFGIYGA
ncbi:uncharacterized protein EV422DRAFT_567974 [Fimicolochytrium jonesii]|uniref:uncharacterized protein n=1 Tax=Fimicolochytrium jonesii TaxID=1396493 RepID=UPI0022FE3CD8|nr:uncharacterized protein EV422DRAFT_567974 [Fimicolochytrium jonesii]KAI8820547.1 hypothetical protein EV422DRAFT_567974 [Fimicolochytrium jonesii]